MEKTYLKTIRHIEQFFISLITKNLNAPHIIQVNNFWLSDELSTLKTPFDVEIFVAVPHFLANERWEDEDSNTLFGVFVSSFTIRLNEPLRFCWEPFFNVEFSFC